MIFLLCKLQYTNAHIWNRDRLYEIMVFGTYWYVPVCTEYIPVRNAENGTYQYVLVCTQYVQVL